MISELKLGKKVRKSISTHFRSLMDTVVISTETLQYLAKEEVINCALNIVYSRVGFVFLVYETAITLKNNTTKRKLHKTIQVSLQLAHSKSY